MQFSLATTAKSVGIFSVLGRRPDVRLFIYNPTTEKVAVVFVHLDALALIFIELERQ